jgi:transcription termination/antitermination protein NusG
MPDNLNAVDPALLTSVPAVAIETTTAEEVSPVIGPADPLEPPPNPSQEHSPDPAPEAAPEQESAAETAAEGASGDGAPPVATEAPEPPSDTPPPSKMRWYVVKVQSGREDSIKESIERRVKIEGLEEYYGQIIIPVEVVTEMRNGRRVKKEHKLYPGYLMVEVEYNDRILYLFRETSGVGDFVGHTIVGGVTRPPVPMTDQEVERMLRRDMSREKGEVAPTPVISKPKFDRGDRLRVNDGTFAGMEGEVMEINQEKGLVKLQLTIFGRGVNVDLEFWQVEKV